MAGLDATGFTVKTQTEIRDEINEDVKTAFGQSVGVSDDDILGRLIAIFAEREANLWELAEGINTSTDPDSATGAQQDSVCAITGTIREAAKNSTVNLTLTGTAATVVTTGSQASVTGTGEKFTTLADATLVLLTAWAATTAYVVDDRRSNGGNVYLCIVAGTSGAAPGPTSEGASISDGTVTWRFLGNGLSAVDVAAAAANTGATVGASGDIITIETPISGWDSVMNILDAVIGSAIEPDETLRARREEELAAPGTAPIDALRVDLLAVTGVTTVKLFVNNTDTVDADGVPPHAVEAMIQGGANQDIWDQLLASVAAGILTHGDVSGTAVDSEANDHTMKFSRPTEIDIHVDITLTFDVTLYPTDGDDQVEAAIVAINYATGKDVVSSQIKGAIVEVRDSTGAIVSGVAGVNDVSLAEIGLSPPPTVETTIVITSRQLAVHDTARITVDSSAATP